MRYIGLSCLREWLAGKRHCKETPYVNSYIWKGLECEICKDVLQVFFKDGKGKEISLIKFNIHEGCQNYMVIDSMTLTTSKTVHVVNFDARPNIRVGRQQGVEVRITDISVSRHHSSISLR